MTCAWIFWGAMALDPAASGGSQSFSRLGRLTWLIWADLNHSRLTWMDLNPTRLTWVQSSICQELSLTDW